MKLRIKIGGDAARDMAEIIRDPSKGRPGTHTVYLKSADELYDLLSPKKMEMLIAMVNYPSKTRTVNDVSNQTGRKQEAISRDASALTKHKLIEKIRKGRNTLLKAKYDTIEICLAN